MTALGTKVRKIRELKSLTQEFMADKLNMSQSMYSKYEADETEIKPDLLKQIADILELTPQQIEAFDEKVVFHNPTQNNESGSTVSSFYAVNVHQYVIDSEIEKLYKKNIELLEEKIKALEKELGK